MSKNSLYHFLPTGPRPPDVVFCVVEVPKGKTNKYEYNEEGGYFFLDRVLYEAVFYPTEYGLIPQTRGCDGDPLDIMVFSTFPTFSGCVIKARPIGVLRLNDSGDRDDKIIAVPTGDPRFADIKNLKDLNPHAKKEIENFWQNYAELQPDKKIKVLGWSEARHAKKIIREAMARYQNPDRKA